MGKDTVAWPKSWTELTKLTQGEPLEVERVRITRTGIAIEGRFELPALVQMSAEDQAFISAFLRSHGSIKEMESLFGISYPTVKARLTRIAEQLPFAETVTENDSSKDDAKRKSANYANNLREQIEELTRTKILDQLASGKITTEKALKLIRGKDQK